MLDPIYTPGTTVRVNRYVSLYQHYRYGIVKDAYRADEWVIIVEFHDGTVWNCGSEEVEAVSPLEALGDIQ